MKNIRSYFIIIWTFFIGVPLSAQESQPQANFPNSPSPTAATLANYAQLPVTENNGLVPINVPLHTVKGVNLNVPIGLSHNLGGVRVEQEASWVGMNMSLIGAGGVISREIRSIPDDVLQIYNPFPGEPLVADQGWLINLQDGYGKLEDFPCIHREGVAPLTSIGNCPNESVPYPYNPPSHWEGAAFHQLSGKYQGKIYDVESDIYYINVANIQAKFIFGHDGRAKILHSNRLNLKITSNIGDDFDPNNTANFTASSTSFLDTFFVTDESGIKYTFAQKEMTKNTQRKVFAYATFIVGDKIQYTHSFHNIEKEYASSWFLTKIEKLVVYERNRVNYILTFIDNQLLTTF